MLDQWTALLVSLAIEVPVVVMFGWAIGRCPKVELGWLALVALSGSCLTLPAAFALHRTLSEELPLSISFLIVVGAAIAVETVFYSYVMRIGRRRAFAYSLLANGFAAFGLMLLVLLRA